MNSATLKSIVLFLLNDVDVKTNENAIELFERWRKTTHYCVKDPLEVKWCLEYLNAMKSFNRDLLIFITNLQKYNYIAKRFPSCSKRW